MKFVRGQSVFPAFQNCKFAQFALSSSRRGSCGWCKCGHWACCRDGGAGGRCPLHSNFLHDISIYFIYGSEILLTCSNKKCPDMPNMLFPLLLSCHPLLVCQQTPPGSHFQQCEPTCWTNLRCSKFGPFAFCKIVLAKINNYWVFAIAPSQPAM